MAGGLGVLDAGMDSDTGKLALLPIGVKYARGTASDLISACWLLVTVWFVFVRLLFVLFLARLACPYTARFN